jgi:hypothetical protein
MSVAMGSCIPLMLVAYSSCYRPLISPQLSLRVPNNEARQSLHALRLAFEEAERHVPGVCVALVAEIVESVESVDEEGE